MTVLYPAQTPAISHRQSSTVSTTGLNQFAVFEVFKTSAGTQSGVNYTESNSTSHYQLRGNAGNTMILRVRMSGGNVTSSAIAISNDTEYKFLTTAEINNVTTSENVVRFYSGSGAQLGSDVSIDGQSYIVSTLQTRQNGDTVADQTRGPLYIWHGVMPNSATIAQAFAGVAPEDFDIPPTDIYKQNGTIGAHADTLTDDGAPANDMTQIAGATSAPDWPTYLTAGISIDDIDGDGQIDDGQGTFTVTTSGFGGDINSLTVSDGTYTSANLFNGGTGGSYTGNSTSFSTDEAGQASGQPNWFTGTLELTAGDGSDTASAALTWAPDANWTAVTLVGDTYALGHWCYNTGRGAAFPDGSVVYYNTTEFNAYTNGTFDALTESDSHVMIWDSSNGAIERVLVSFASQGVSTTISIIIGIGI